MERSSRSQLDAVVFEARGMVIATGFAFQPSRRRPGAFAASLPDGKTFRISRTTLPGSAFYSTLITTFPRACPPSR